MLLRRPSRRKPESLGDDDVTFPVLPAETYLQELTVVVHIDDAVLTEPREGSAGIGPTLHVARTIERRRVEHREGVTTRRGIVAIGPVVDGLAMRER